MPESTPDLVVLDEPPRRYAAGHATYPGDVQHMVGEVKGPTTFGTLLVADSATYDAPTDRTRVGFVTTLPTDSVKSDGAGTLRLAEAVA